MNCQSKGRHSLSNNTKKGSQDRRHTVCDSIEIWKAFYSSVQQIFIENLLCQVLSVLQLLFSGK